MVILNAILICAICMFMTMLLTYIAQKKGQLNAIMIENLNLFDKMNEGLVVISQKDKSIKFASKPAISLLK